VLKSLGGIGAISTIGSVSASAQTSNRVKWSFKAELDIRTSPTVVGGGVFCGSDYNRVLALNAETGKKEWMFNTIDQLREGDVRSAPEVKDGIAYVGSNEGAVYALDAATGEKKWDFGTRGQRKDPGGEVESSPTVVDGTVFFGSRDNYVYAVDAENGESQWEFETGGDVYASPVIVDDTVFIGSSDTNVYALNATTGEEKWSFDAGGYRSGIGSSGTVVGQTLFVPSNDRLYALNTETGEEKWNFEVGDTIWTAPTVQDNIVFFASQDTYIYAVNIESEEQEWRTDLRLGTQSAPTVVEDTLFIGGGGDGKFHALDATNGEKKWSFETEDGNGTFNSSPVVVDGVAFIGCQSNNHNEIDNIYAFETDVNGSSEDTLVNLGTLGHHHQWAGQTDYDNTDDVDIVNPDLDPSEVTGSQSQHTLTFEAHNVSADGGGDEFSITFPDNVAIEEYSNVDIDSKFSDVEQNGETLNFKVSPIGGGITKISVSMNITLSVD
jgi:outer membrane protein assembly factor BamB